MALYTFGLVITNEWVPTTTINPGQISHVQAHMQRDTTRMYYVTSI